MQLSGLSLDVIARARALLVRSLAIVAVVLAYVFSGVGAQVASIAGLSGFAVFATSQPAEAGYQHRRRRRRRRRGGHRGGY